MISKIKVHVQAGRTLYNLWHFLKVNDLNDDKVKYKIVSPIESINFQGRAVMILSPTTFIIFYCLVSASKLRKQKKNKQKKIF